MSQQHAPGPLTVAVSADNNNAHTVTSAALASDMGNGDARFDETLAYIAARLPAGWQPTMAVICGSGLGGLVDAVTAVEKDGERVELDYADVPHFARSTGRRIAVRSRVGARLCS